MFLKLFLQTSPKNFPGDPGPTGRFHRRQSAQVDSNGGLLGHALEQFPGRVVAKSNCTDLSNIRTAGHVHGKKKRVKTKM